MPTMLRIGSKGPDVRKLQEGLNRFGYKLKADAHFGRKTDMAVRDFQRKVGLIPDGVAGSRTMKALAPKLNLPKTNSLEKNIEAYFLAASQIVSATFGSISQRLGYFLHQPPQAPQTRHMSTRLPPTYPHGMTTSNDGKRFIYTHETMKGVSNKLHWPRGNSGVTIGPGYDMGSRKSDEIKRDLIVIGVDPAVAEKVAIEAAGLKGEDANKFVNENKDRFVLTGDREWKLLLRILPSYEATVRRLMATTPLMKYQFDALVSVAYNPGGRLDSITSLLRNGQTDNAMKEVLRRDKSKGITLRGLQLRRQDEVRLYLKGEYGALRTI